MANQGERDLIALVQHEQRGFRFILFSGFALLLVLAIMSVALGFYYWRASEQLQNTIARQRFDTRTEFDQQRNAVAAQDRRLNRIHDEIRRMAGADAASLNDEGALRAAEAYLLRGHLLSLAEENAIEAAAQRAPASALKHFLSGAAQLNTWSQRNNANLPQGATALPAELVGAREAFEAAAQADPAFAMRASAGLARLLYLEASGLQPNYQQARCQAVFDAVSAAPPDSPQLLWQQAQCERKLGRTGEALRDYARMLERTWQTANTTRDEGELLLAMNAYHGVGTTLIVMNDASDPAVAAALPLARQACAPEGDALMAHALACMNRAVALRRRMRQTPNEVSGTQENLGFAYLRTGDFQGAFDNAEAVEDTGLFAWNELVRAIAAKHLGLSDAEAGARRNVGFFEGVGSFAPCEIKRLLNPDLFQEALDILSREHSRAEVDGAVAACPA